jgi:hypothetical protein
MGQDVKTMARISLFTVLALFQQLIGNAPQSTSQSVSKGVWTHFPAFARLPSQQQTLRRTGFRAMFHCTIPERVATTLRSHRTRSVFERYKIASEDLREAAQKMNEPVPPAPFVPVWFTPASWSSRQDSHLI